ncbi:MAG: hypothetical protein WC699_09125 [Bacteroidales bacterium]|jgi:hypothetical protein
MNLIAKHSRSRVGFADLYLERYGSGSFQDIPEPDPELFLSIIIPAYKEPDLASALRSLLDCDPPGVRWEIIININYPENSPSDVVNTSKKSLEEAQKIGNQLNRSDVQIHCLWNPDIPSRHAGVGLARKMAMDQAVSRFNRIGRPEGVLLSFDADSTCHAGYLKSVVTFYKRNPGARTANIYFEHPLNGGFEPRIYHSIAQYELYLRYMRLSIEGTGHPHSIHTVGSSFSVRSKTYIRVNGMGRDKAGEDFYFLHKCIQLKNFWEINDTVVSPSVRESDRVSFGTGASVHRQMQNESSLEVYASDSFNPLGILFGRIDDFWAEITEGRNPEVCWTGISPGLAEFMKSQNASRRLSNMFSDSAGMDTFRAKFFAWFNGFMILRYLNEVHKDHYQKKSVLSQALRLAAKLNIGSGASVEELLIQFRNFEKGRGNRKII